MKLQDIMEGHSITSYDRVYGKIKLKLANETSSDIAYQYKGKYHRNDGKPAVVFDNGTKTWYKDGDLHREDGPAIEFMDGRKAWYLNGNAYTEEAFDHIMRNQ